MYGENQRLAEGIPSTMILRNITALIPIYSVGSFFLRGDFYLVLKVASPTCILSLKCYTSFNLGIS